jgi:DNA-binding NarL/FixJ family response regulator
VSYATIRNHVQHLLRKLGAHSLLEAVARSLV